MGGGLADGSRDMDGAEVSEIISLKINSEGGLMFIERIKQGGSLYITRIRLTPTTPWGWLQLHIFSRGDTSEDLHDHPFDFWTFPLHNYAEEVGARVGKRFIKIVNFVERFRWHYRLSTYTHRVIGRTPVGLNDPLWTLIWRTHKYREWGFFEDGEKIPWQEYYQKHNI